MQYLKACIKGEAASTIKSFPITEGNNIEVWKLLEPQFDNKREIIISHVKRLLFQPSLKHESVSSLQELINTILESIRSLKVLGQETEKWDAILVVILVEKFHGETKAEWAKSLKATSPSSFQETQDFIIQHIKTPQTRSYVSAKNQVSGMKVTNSFGAPKKFNTHHTSF